MGLSRAEFQIIRQQLGDTSRIDSKQHSTEDDLGFFRNDK